MEKGITGKKKLPRRPGLACYNKRIPEERKLPQVGVWVEASIRHPKPVLLKERGR